jgi:hypothetical protein
VDDSASHGSSYTSQALKTAAPFTNITPSQLIGRTSKEKIVSNITGLVSQCLTRCTSAFSSLTASLNQRWQQTAEDSSNPSTRSSRRPGSQQLCQTNHPVLSQEVRRLLATLSLLEHALQGPLNLSPKGLPFSLFCETFAAAVQLCRTALRTTARELDGDRLARGAAGCGLQTDSVCIGFVPNPDERRGGLLEIGAGAGVIMHDGSTLIAKVTDESTVSSQIMLRQVLTILSTLICCMAKMHSFESTFKNRVRNVLDDLKSDLVDIGRSKTQQNYLSRIST